MRFKDKGCTYHYNQVGEGCKLKKNRLGFFNRFLKISFSLVTGTGTSMKCVGCFFLMINKKMTHNFFTWIDRPHRVVKFEDESHNNWGGGMGVGIFLCIY